MAGGGRSSKLFSSFRIFMYRTSSLLAAVPGDGQRWGRQECSSLVPESSCTTHPARWLHQEIEMGGGKCAGSQQKEDIAAGPQGSTSLPQEPQNIGRSSCPPDGLPGSTNWAMIGP